MQEDLEALFLLIPLLNQSKTIHATERVVSAHNTAYIRIYVYKKVKRTIKRGVQKRLQ